MLCVYSCRNVKKETDRTLVGEVKEFYPQVGNEKVVEMQKKMTKKEGKYRYKN